MTTNGTATDLNAAALKRSGVHPADTGLDGTGIVICCIDYGFDLLHPTLRTAAGETRFADLIDQNGATLERAGINRLIRACESDGTRDCLDAVYDPHSNYFGGASGVGVGAHGTWVASLAAGGHSRTFTGVAPNAIIIGVQLDLPDGAWWEVDGGGGPAWLTAAERGPDALRGWRGWRSYEESPAIVRALEAGYRAASRLKPDGIIINLSIGAWAGAHDGGSPVNRAITEIARAGAEPGHPMCAVVAATGNAGAERGHVGRAPGPDREVRLIWRFEPGSQEQSKLEIWSDAGELSVDIAMSDRSDDRLARPTAVVDQVARRTGAGTFPIALKDGRIIGVCDDRGCVRGTLHGVRLLLCPALAAELVGGDGASFEVIVRTTGTRGTVHAWLERDRSGTPQATLQGVGAPERDRESGGAVVSTLTPLACAAGVIGVAGLDALSGQPGAAAFSGRGPRPWDGSASNGRGLPSPALAAPAVGLCGARSKSAGFMRGRGTSGAAAIVSGAVAQAMQGATQRGERLDTEALVGELIGRRLTSKVRCRWRPDIGFGALDVTRDNGVTAGNRRRIANRRSEEVVRDEPTLSAAD